MLSRGISPLIGAVIIISITITSIVLVLLIGLPAIDRGKESAILQEATQNMKLIDNLIREVASEGIGALRSATLKVSGGQYFVNEKANDVEFLLLSKTGILQPGTIVKDGNVLLTVGGIAKASIYDLDNDGTNDLVLENQYLRVGILNNGTASSYSTINTSRLVKVINWKTTNTNVTTVDSRIVLDDFTDTSIGNGYTELIASGNNLPKAEAVAHVNTTIVKYDVVYTLHAAADFVIVKIQNAYYR